MERKYKVDVHSLFVNPSEKCNLKCSICQCGDATKQEITRTVAESIFCDLEHISNFNFINGEVMLVPQAVKLINAVMKEYGVTHSSFNGFFNGTRYNQEVMDELLDIMLRSKEKQFASGWSVSIDEWHLEAALKILSRKEYGERLSKLLSSPLVSFRTSTSQFILNEGRAVNADSYGLPKFELNSDMYIPHCYVDESKNKIYVANMIVSCQGDAIITSEYARQKSTAYGNVVESGGVANLLLNSDKIKRYDSYEKYVDAYHKTQDNESERRKKLGASDSFCKARFLRLNKEINELIK